MARSVGMRVRLMYSLATAADAFPVGVGRAGVRLTALSAGRCACPRTGVEYVENAGVLSEARPA